MKSLWNKIRNCDCASRKIDDCVAMGLTFGMLAGLIFGNLPMGLLLGVLAGALVGYRMDRRAAAQV